MILDKSLEMVAIEFVEEGSVPCWKVGSTVCEGLRVKLLHCSDFSPFFLGGNCHGLHQNRDKGL
jgi:hypothetical protein